MRRIVITIIGLVAILALGVGACAPSSESMNAADFYKNNTTTCVVTFSPGGGVDFGARLVASYWSEVTDGPAMKVKNMTGAGGLVGGNYVYAAEPDGLTIGTTNTGSLNGPALLGTPGVEFELDKFSWIGLMTENPAGFALGTGTSYKTIEDLQKAGKTILLGTTLIRLEG